ncbi:hypothetical protein LCGC14_1702920, partial [marine sediment metagenome]
MSTYEFTDPTGKKYRVTGPEGSTSQDAFKHLQTSLSAGTATVQPAKVEVPAPAPSSTGDVISGMVQRSKFGEADQRRILNTGITPGTAAEFASSHIQDLRNRIGEVSEGRQKAIFDLYKEIAGRNDLSSQDFEAERIQAEQERKFDTLIGRAEIAARKFGNLGPRLLGDITSVVDPETGQYFVDQGEKYFGTAEAKSGTREFGLNLGPEALKLVGLAATGPAGMATVYGATGFGGQRREVARLRTEGQDVSGLEELRTAAAVGGVEAVSGYIGGRIFGRMGKILKGASPSMQSLIQGGNPNAVKELLRQAVTLAGGSFAEGAEEGIAQGITNMIRSGIDPEVALTDGVAESILMGAVLAPLGAAGSPHLGTQTESGNVKTGQTAIDMAHGAQETTPIAQEVGPQASRPISGQEAQFIGQEQATEPITDREAQFIGQQEARAPQTQQEKQFVGLQGVAPSRQEQDKFFAGVSPQASEAKRTSKIISDAVTEEADDLIADLKSTGDVRPETEDKIKNLVNEARRNPVTGGMNRYAFERVFDTLRQRARKTKQPLSLISLDAANLKVYNDQLSESAGNDYLRKIQDTIQGVLRESGEQRVGDAFHYGGDEWAILLPDTDETGTQIVRDRIEEAFGKEEIVPGVSAFLTGDSVTLAPGSRKSWEAVTSEAVAKMKERKVIQKREAGEAVDRPAALAMAKDNPTPQEVETFHK